MADRTQDPIEELSVAETYEIPFDVQFEDSENGVKMEYAGCGSHAIKATGTIDLKEAKRLLAVLSALPGINGTD